MEITDRQRYEQSGFAKGCRDVSKYDDKNEEVAMSVLLKIATYLDCDISDMCEFVKDDDKNE